MFFLFHSFSLYDLRERVNFQRAYLYILLDIIPVFFYNKTERAFKTKQPPEHIFADFSERIGYGSKASWQYAQWLASFSFS
jgi:hypothetical protein